MACRETDRGPQSPVRGKRRYSKCKRVQRERERHSDTGKLDPEREIAGGKVPVLRPGCRCDCSFPH